MRAALETRKRCYNHPHRETTLTCDRCKTSYCAECLGEYGDDKVCRVCRQELVDFQAAQLTFGQKAANSARSFGNGLIVTTIVLAVLAGVFYFSRGWFDKPLTPEEMARFRYAMAGSFETEEGVNVSSTVMGAQVISATSAAEGHPAKQLINEYTGPAIPAWRSADATFPQEIVVELQDGSVVQKVILTNNTEEPAATYPMTIEVLVSTQAADAGFVAVGQFTLSQTADPQRLEFAPTPAKWAKLRILGNYGSTEYTSLDEWDTYQVPLNSPRFPRGTPAASPAKP